MTMKQVFAVGLISGLGVALVGAMIGTAVPMAAQEPVGWEGEELIFHTFSIAAVDPETGESGVAVTTRNACVGNGVPWVRVGVGAVATQASTRTEYGDELLSLIAEGVSPADALEQRLADDQAASRRQIGVIGIDGRSAQHTGDISSWSGHRAGLNYAAQGNTLVGPEVIAAVADSFEASEGTHRHLADRLIEALNAGHVLGGDARHGRMQSAAVIVADPRPGMARRTDGLTVQINVCENPDPVGEMRRIYNTISETLGFRTLEQHSGRDVLQLKMMLHGLGYFRSDSDEFPSDLNDRNLYTSEAVEAVNQFRSDQGWRTSVAGFVDAATVDRLWAQLDEAGKTDDIRLALLNIQRIRR